MLTTKVARRYATALLEISKERDEVDAILEDVNLIHNTLEGSDELNTFLRSPVIKFDDKKEALNEIFGDKVQEVTITFINLLARKGRIHLLDQITEAFVQKYNEYAGIIEIDIYSARELSNSQRERLHNALEEKTSKKVNMHVSLDESLKGGISVRIDDTVIDGTVKHKLEELEQQLLATAVE